MKEKKLSSYYRTSFVKRWIESRAKVKKQKSNLQTATGFAVLNS